MFLLIANNLFTIIKANSLVIGQIITLIGIAGKLLGSFNKISFRKQKSITMTILPKHIDEDLLCERPHIDLLISNTGRTPIKCDEIITPIHFLNGQDNIILDARITFSDPKWMNLKIDLSKSSLIFHFDFLNVKDKFVIRIYHNGLRNLVPRFRIIGLMKIQIRSELVRNKKLWTGVIVLGVILMLLPFDNYIKSVPHFLRSTLVSILTLIISAFATRWVNFIEIKKIRKLTNNGSIFQSEALDSSIINIEQVKVKSKI